ncbi:MAG: ABC transporter permease [Clostridia bacterium]|nr:ABC transporter permease [Clostridia bacterium]
MKKIIAFSKRNALEIARDPLKIVFGAGLHVVLIYLLSAIQKNIPASLFEITSLMPGVVVFSLSFVTLFSSLLIAKDRQGMLLTRLYTTPMRAGDFVIGYMLPLLPIGLVQAAVCVIASVPLGVEISGNLLLMLIVSLPVILFNVSLGLLFGSILTDKQVGGVCGALLTNVSAWLSGIWFDVDLVGGAFSKIANALPFIHAVEAERCALAGNMMGVLNHIWVVLVYAILALLLAVYLFLRQMRK